ncbi:adenylosuccinate lyase [Natrarchaeobaculum aegyptiacum]|uniref:Adenylosuccinate lyase n=1 Tax=Natrarchaeobaculum aegyptiacum TaxID=745377 RepID=A0A2Z2HY34_9EURY|nr:adenylosuccinate lyase [Natrarchaeobaculum aegyptiacum]ARS90637.1 adenylosuccinate lyase [Natrarchaeobaculum aegyptiacum]
MTDTNALYAVSPLDGRYSGRTAPLSPYASEAALMRARVRVEVEYLLALADLEVTPLEIDVDERDQLRGLYRSFAEEDARLIKKLETEGHAGFEATNHDVKAVEYYIRHNLPANSDASAWIHFGLTSEDVNNLAHRLLVRDAVEDVLLPELHGLADTLGGMAREYRDLSMLARTHGQPATPTTFGKEMAVYAGRLGTAIGRIRRATDGLRGKLGGASGTYAAHHAAYPDVDWQAFARSFIEDDLALGFEPLTTQVNPCDDLATLFDALRGANDVLLDLDLDMWLYVSDRYLGQEAVAGETGSSTMPHKVNPIDFENSEGNLSKANSDLTFLADYVTTSRLQRDLSDSTVKRNIGGAFAHCLIGYNKTAAGLSKVVPNEQVMRDDLDDTPAILGEAVQTILRREGQEDAYEQVKALTRGREVTLEDFRDLFDDLDVDEGVREELHALTPATYTGVADDLIDDLE